MISLSFVRAVLRATRSELAGEQRSRIHCQPCESAVQRRKDAAGVIESYGGGEVRYPADALLYPASLDDARLAMRYAGGANLRGGGFSFGQQALAPADAALVHTRRLDLGPIEVGPETVSAPGNRCWGHVVDRCLEAQRIPKILVTGSGTTVGGTLASNGISRHTPIWGKEISAVRSFDLLAWDGTHHCGVTADGDPDLFHATIGGFGGTGLITRVEHDLVALPSDFAVHTTVRRYEDAHAFARQLRPKHTSGTRTRYGIVFPGLFGSFRGIVMDSWYAPRTGSLSYPAYSPWGPGGMQTLKAGFYAMAADPRIVQALKEQGWLLSWSCVTYNDYVLPYTFFQDGHVMSKDLMRRVPYRDPITTLQQTWIVPADEGTEQPRLADFLSTVEDLTVEPFTLPGLGEQQLAPTAFIDTFYVPADQSWLSASRDLPGFAVTVAFEGPQRHCDRAIAVLGELTERCAELGGRVHLTKHVHGAPETIRAMYGEAAEEWRRVQQQHDPNGRWRNAQWVGIFGWG